MSDSNTTQIEQNENQISNYPSSSVLLATVQKEYEYESERAKRFEERTGILISFDGVLLVFILSNLKLSSIIANKIPTIWGIISSYLFITFIFITFIAIIASIFSFVRVVSAKKYNRITLDKFNQISAALPKENVEVGLIKSYKDVILFNSETNNKKIFWYKVGLYSMLVSLSLTCIVYGLSLLM
ncbi:hypothetical protein [Clostridium estertheticum]|uniref:hypothetical protein n=1 Tax=Clostridium estertheticum TaxID=238834 RepID=UPI001C7E18B4|nr:hypothetical protein [Clostridium estertheticum]MBX4271462.1 hypothetical protein [Clostridium estertheticum]WLC81015.1 hypothetical protein KTC98_07265 [Clostridium estertheticum]